MSGSVAECSVAKRTEATFESPKAVRTLRFSVPEEGYQILVELFFRLFGPNMSRNPPNFSLDSPPMAERSRFPLAGIGQTALERKEEVPNEILLEARLNSVDWVATQTVSLVHRDQELQASKQFPLMG